MHTLVAVLLHLSPCSFLWQVPPEICSTMYKNKRQVTVYEPTNKKILAQGNTSAYLLSSLTSGVLALSATGIRADTSACRCLAAAGVSLQDDAGGVSLARRPFGEFAFAKAAGCTTSAVTSPSFSSLPPVSFFSIFTRTLPFSILLYSLKEHSPC